MKRAAMLIFMTTLAGSVGLAPINDRIALAQDEGYFLSIGVRDCNVDSSGEPSDCVIDEGVTMTVETPTGDLIGSCVTEVIVPLPGSEYTACSVVTPFDTEVIVSQDSASVADGYTPTQGPIAFTTPSRNPDGIVGPDVYFLNALQVDDPVTVLPDTGSGPMRSTVGQAPLPLATALILLGAIALAVKRRAFPQLSRR